MCQRTVSVITLLGKQHYCEFSQQAVTCPQLMISAQVDKATHLHPANYTEERYLKSFKMCLQNNFQTLVVLLDISVNKILPLPFQYVVF